MCVHIVVCDAPVSRIPNLKTLIPESECRAARSGRRGARSLSKTPRPWKRRATACSNGSRRRVARRPLSRIRGPAVRRLLPVRLRTAAPVPMSVVPMRRPAPPLPIAAARTPRPRPRAAATSSSTGGSGRRGGGGLGEKDEVAPSAPPADLTLHPVCTFIMILYGYIMHVCMLACMHASKPSLQASMPVCSMHATFAYA